MSRSSALPRHVNARAQVLVAALIGVLAAALATLLTAPRYGVLIGWDVTCAAYLLWVWRRIWHLDAALTEALSEHEDPTRATADALFLTAAVASLVAVGFVLGTASQTSGSAELVRVGLGLGSVILSWGLVHTVFTLRYARLYYRGIDGGVDFKQPDPPMYSDFAYLAFTVGMTFQVADTDLQDHRMRRTVLGHALLSFMFGTGILAATINLVASITSH
jgi:uncharacterized membrane protein